MKRVLLFSVAVLLGGGILAHAEYLEIEASQIATIASGDRAASPRLLVQWALPDSLSAKIIDGAAISMTLNRSDRCPLEVEVFPLTRSWLAESVGWESGWSRVGGEYNDSLSSPAIATERTGGKISASVNDAVLDHIAGRRSNFGFILVPDAQSECKLREFESNDRAKLADAKLIIAFRNRR